MSPVLLVMLATDAPVFGEIATRFSTRKIGVLFLFFNRCAVLVSASESLFLVAGGSHNGVYSEIVETG